MHIMFEWCIGIHAVVQVQFVQGQFDAFLSPPVEWKKKIYQIEYCTGIIWRVKIRILTNANRTQYCY